MKSEKELSVYCKIHMMQTIDNGKDCLERILDCHIQEQSMKFLIKKLIIYLGDKKLKAPMQVIHYGI